MNIYIMKKDKPIKSLDFLEYICKTKNIPFNKNDIYYNEHNKPYYKDFYFNTSHSKNYIILAISTKEVGIDIEEERSYHHNLYRKVLSSEDINNNITNILETWSLKEAYSKYKGIGISIGFTNISVNNIKNNNIVHNLSNNNYYCFIVGEEQINSIETIDYQYYLKRK